jgi:quercetin dioxygenase-like cupin family protein
MRDRRVGFGWGMLAGAGLTALLSATSGMSREAAAASPPAGPAKYTARVVLENERVRVRDVTFPPGVLDTGMHTHPWPHVGVILTAGRLVFTEPGKAAETVTFDVGSVGYREANVTHQAANPGDAPMRVIEVELK